MWNRPLPSNYCVALRQFQYLRQKLRVDPEQFDRYKAVLHTQLELGYGRKMTPPEAATSSSITNYLPHRDVYSLHKVKPRIVQDAAAKFHGVSINDKLLSGPDLLNSLVVVLLRFRVGETLGWS